jgi:transposase
VAHTILVIVHHLLRTGDVYRDLGANYFDERDKTTTVKRAVARISRLGYDVTVVAKVA